MVTTANVYTSLAQQFAELWSEDNVEFVIQTNEKKIDVAQCALSLYLGWETEQGFFADMQRGNETNKQGKISLVFLDTLPRFDSEESEDPKARQEARNNNVVCATYYDENDTTSKGLPRKKDFFEEFIRYLKPEGEYLYNRMRAIKQLEDQPNSPLTDDHTHVDLNDMNTTQLGTEKGYIQSKINTLASMARDATGIYQQFALFQNEWSDYKDASDHKNNEAGLRIYLNTNVSGEIARTKSPFVLQDTAIRPQQESKWSVSQFLRVDIKKAASAHRRGVASIKALKETMKRQAEQTTAGVHVKNLDEFVKFIQGVNDYMSAEGTSRLLDVRLLDPKRGASTALPMGILLYEYLLPLEPVIKPHYLKFKEKEASKANNTRTNDAPPVDQKIETPRAKLMRLRAAGNK